jgi:hypothetical protein
VKDELQERIGANESVFREINESIERGQWPGEEDEPASFRCECARLGCSDLIELSVREYERVRAHPRRFVVRPGHQLPEAETVVETRPGYVVIEKLEAAAEKAEESDPRG